MKIVLTSQTPCPTVKGQVVPQSERSAFCLYDFTLSLSGNKLCSAFYFSKIHSGWMGELASLVYRLIPLPTTWKAIFDSRDAVSTRKLFGALC